MGFSDNFRTTHDNKEILRILQKSTQHENLLWQTHALGRTVIPVQHMEIDFVSREVVVHFDSLHFQVETDLPLYVKLDYRSTVFKVTDYKIKDSCIHFALPKDLKTLELRGFVRHSFPVQSSESVTLRPTSSVNEKSSEIEVRLIDLSQTGMGLLVSEYNRVFLKNNRILWVGRIRSLVLPDPVLAEVVYMNQDFDPKLVSKKDKSFKVGLKLSSELSLETFNSLIKEDL